jgi:hypothetical protein
MAWLHRPSFRQRRTLSASDLAHLPTPDERRRLQRLAHLVASGAVHLAEVSDLDQLWQALAEQETGNDNDANNDSDGTSESRGSTSALAARRQRTSTAPESEHGQSDVDQLWHRALTAASSTAAQAAITTLLRTVDAAETEHLRRSWQDKNAAQRVALLLFIAGAWPAHHGLSPLSLAAVTRLAQRAASDTTVPPPTLTAAEFAELRAALATLGWSSGRSGQPSFANLVATATGQVASSVVASLAPLIDRVATASLSTAANASLKQRPDVGSLLLPPTTAPISATPQAEKSASPAASSTPPSARMVSQSAYAPTSTDLHDAATLTAEHRSSTVESEVAAQIAAASAFTGAHAANAVTPAVSIATLQSRASDTESGHHLSPAPPVPITDVMLGEPVAQLPAVVSVQKATSVLPTSADDTTTNVMSEIAANGADPAMLAQVGASPMASSAVSATDRGDTSQVDPPHAVQVSRESPDLADQLGAGGTGASLISGESQAEPATAFHPAAQTDPRLHHRSARLDGLEDFVESMASELGTTSKTGPKSPSISELKEPVDHESDRVRNGEAASETGHDSLPSHSAESRSTTTADRNRTDLAKTTADSSTTPNTNAAGHLFATETHRLSAPDSATFASTISAPAVPLHLPNSPVSTDKLADSHLTEQPIEASASLIDVSKPLSAVTTSPINATESTTPAIDTNAHPDHQERNAHTGVLTIPDVQSQNSDRFQSQNSGRVQSDRP